MVNFINKRVPTRSEKTENKFFVALRHRNFRLLLSGSMVSHVGDEFQLVALTWLVLRMTDSPFLVGVIYIFHGLPRLFFGLLGGVIADRVDRYRLLIICEGLAMVLSFFLAFLVLVDKIQFWQILVILPCMAYLKSIFQVARQSYIFDLVGRKDLLNALTMHSVGMNLSKILGPALAGIIIGIWGVGWCLFIDGVSFIVILLTLFMMDTLPAAYKRSGKTSFSQDLAETFTYLRQHRTLLILIVAPLFYVVFGFHPHLILAIYANQILNVGASGYGLLLSAIAVGGVVGGVVLAGLGDLETKGAWFLAASLSYACMLIIFSFSPWFLLSLFLLFLTGITQMFFRTINNTLVQLFSPDELRAKIQGVILLDKGMRPLGSFLMGAGASLIGAPLTVAIGAGIFGFFTLGLLIKTQRIREL